MDTPKRKRGRPAGQLTTRQAAVLADLLEDRPFLEIADRHGMAKSQVAELVNYLRGHGLVGMPGEDSGIKFGEPTQLGGPPKVVWFRDGSDFWQLVGVQLPHVISSGRHRTHLVPDRVLVAVLGPVPELVFIVSNRQRVSYNSVAARMTRVGIDAENNPLVVRRLTECIALLVDQEAVFPAWFMADDQNQPS